MKFLVYSSNMYGEEDLKAVLHKKGHSIKSIKYVFSNFEKDEYFYNILRTELINREYDAVISFNYFQVVSEVCTELSIKYISWVMDSPTLNLYSKTVLNRFNYIFIFDKALYLDMKSLGVEHVFYLPLAVNVERLDNLIIADEDINQFKSDITFVGSLYDKKISYDALTNLPEYTKGYLEGIMSAQLNVYGYNFIEELLTDDVMETLNQYIHLKLDDNFIGSKRMIFANTFLGVKVTSIERRIVIEKLAKRFQMDLYTSSNTDNIKAVNNRGTIDYYSVMPKVFRLSDINLNITLRNIKTGIPLRVFDIMGAGGFVLTNYQEDLLDYFENGRDLVIYESIDDLINKTSYYLEHEQERKKIAQNGYNKVKQFHNYGVRIDQIIETVFK